MYNQRFSREKREFLKKIIFSGGALWILRYFPLIYPACTGRKTESFKYLTYEVSKDVFPCSVASADVTYSSAWVWTKINPGVQEEKRVESIPLVFELSDTPDFSRVVQRDVVEAKEEFNYTVRLKLRNLREGQKCFYRFIHKNYSSPVGTFKTFSRGQDRLKFAFVSCQDYTNGFYSAYYHLAQEKDIDFVLHLGDYIYEMVHERGFQDKQLRPINLPTVEGSGNRRTYAYYLEDYRHLWETYKSAPYLQMVHERFPFYIIWDDHEFANDCFGANSPDNGKEIAGDIYQPERRRWTNQAFFEYVPGEFFYDPRDSDPIRQVRLWRRSRFGSLAELIITDERLYRSPHICGEGRLSSRYLFSYSDICRDPEEQTMLGEEQLEWFLSSLKKAENDGVIWKVHANEIYMMQMKVNDGENLESAQFFLADQWDSFPYERWKILNFVKENGIRNYFVTTGDLHAFVVGELHEDFFSPSYPPVGVEFVSTSITSESTTGILANILGIRGEEQIKKLEKEFILDRNKHIYFVDSRHHGYTLVELTPGEAIVELYMVDDIDNPKVEQTGKILLKRYRVKRGTNRIEDITP